MYYNFRNFVTWCKIFRIRLYTEYVQIFWGHSNFSTINRTHMSCHIVIISPERELITRRKWNDYFCLPFRELISSLLECQICRESSFSKMVLLFEKFKPLFNLFNSFNLPFCSTYFLSSFSFYINKKHKKVFGRHEIQ